MLFELAYRALICNSRACILQRLCILGRYGAIQSVLHVCRMASLRIYFGFILYNFCVLLSFEGLVYVCHVCVMRFYVCVGLRLNWNQYQSINHKCCSALSTAVRPIVHYSV